MRKIVLVRWVLIACLSSASVAAYAEGGCPDGQYPASGQGWQACYPIPGYGQGQEASVQQTPPPQWKNAWGAIATAFTPKAVLGSSADLSTRDEAEQAALENCRAKGGANCKIEIAYGNQCAVVVVGHPSYGVFTADTLDSASKKGMKACMDGGNTSCRVLYSACSLPRRFQ